MEIYNSLCSASRSYIRGGSEIRKILFNKNNTRNNVSLTFEEYATILGQAEAMVNWRPIAPLNDDPTSLNALTPGHFLIG